MTVEPAGFVYLKKNPDKHMKSGMSGPRSRAILYARAHARVCERAPVVLSQHVWY